MPLVSVCMPAHRDGPELRVAIRSVLEQGHDDLELVLTDDSGGSLRTVVDEVADERIRYFANPAPLGFAGNHSAALAQARGEFIGILHDDDRYLPGFLEATLAPFASDPRMGVVFTDCLLDEGRPEMRRFGAAVAHGRHERILPDLLRASFMLPSKTLMRRAVWDEGRQPWPDNNIADVMMYVDAAIAGWAFFYVDEPLVVYTYHAGQITKLPRFREDLAAFWEHYAFDDPALERLRSGRHAEALVGLAAARLQDGRRLEARALTRRARELDPSVQPRRRAAVAALARAPGGGRVAQALSALRARSF